MEPIRFLIYGKPQAQQRAGEYIGNDGRIHHYDQKESKSYRKVIVDHAFEAVKGKWPIYSGAVSLQVKELRPIPKSWSAKKKLAALAGHIRPTSKPDLKNLVWIVEDALNGLIFKDDSQIVSFDQSGKWYSALPPCLEVIIKPVVSTVKID